MPLVSLIPYTHHLSFDSFLIVNPHQNASLSTRAGIVTIKSLDCIAKLFVYQLCDRELSPPLYLRNRNNTCIKTLNEIVFIKKSHERNNHTTKRKSMASMFTCLLHCLSRHLLPSSFPYKFLGKQTVSPLSVPMPGPCSRHDQKLLIYEPFTKPQNTTLSSSLVSNFTLLR